MPPVLELEGLAVRLGGRPILHGLTGACRRRTIGLLGPNGAGKTTLIHTLLGFHPPAGGAARVFGLDVAGQPDEVRALLGYMPENDAFLAGYSAVRFVAMMAELSGLPPGPALERAHEALFWVGLGEARYRPLGSYSQGMKQLAKLAQAIVHGPRLLLLDEPTNALDPPARERMLRLIEELRDAGETSILVSSHLLRDVERVCEEVVVLKEGRLVAQRDLAAERSEPRRLIEVELRGEEEPFLAALAARGAECAASVDPRGRRRLKAVLPEGVEVSDVFRLAADRGVQIRRLSVPRDSLEEIFLAAMAAPAAEGGDHGRV